MRIYHFTLRRSADRIMREGFRDGEPEIVAGVVRTGIWFADLDLARDEGLSPEEFVTIAVEVPDDVLHPFEVVGNPMVKDGSHREWCVPAEIADAYLDRAFVTARE